MHEEILTLKRQRNALILAHNYQLPDIQDVADFVGDSLELARKSAAVACERIVFCGVTFMAETAKILSPAARVLIPVPGAGCPLADTLTPSELSAFKERYPDAAVVAYVNSSAEVKALSDVCCTSSNAVGVVKRMAARRILFVPDKNLGRWVQKNVPEKEIIVGKGFCYVHDSMTHEHVRAARDLHPAAEMLVHPECPPPTLAAADFVLSTAGILKRARESSAAEFIIGTEEGILYRLRKENPEKNFYALCPRAVCKDMKKTDLAALKHCLEHDEFEVTLDEDLMGRARRAIEGMVQYA